MAPVVRVGGLLLGRAAGASRSSNQGATSQRAQHRHTTGAPATLQCRFALSLLSAALIEVHSGNFTRCLDNDREQDQETNHGPFVSLELLSFALSLSLYCPLAFVGGPTGVWFRFTPKLTVCASPSPVSLPSPDLGFCRSQSAGELYKAGKNRLFPPHSPWSSLPLLLSNCSDLCFGL